jgi:hypothetical protein
MVLLLHSHHEHMPILSISFPELASPGTTHSFAVLLSAL